jgi:hypothetical protein
VYSVFPINSNFLKGNELAYYITKLIITTFLIVLISEIAKRSSLAGALLAAIPLVSILAMTWMYVDTDSSSNAVEFSNRIVWLIAPSMTLFVAFPILIKKGLGFYSSLGISIVMTIFAYYSVIFVLGKFGIKL